MSWSTLRREREAAGEINNAISPPAAVPVTWASICWNPDRIARAYWTHSTPAQWETADPLGSGSDPFDPCLEVTPICLAVTRDGEEPGVRLGVLEQRRRWRLGSTLGQWQRARKGKWRRWEWDESCTGVSAGAYTWIKGLTSPEPLGTGGRRIKFHTSWFGWCLFFFIHVYF